MLSVCCALLVSATQQVDTLAAQSATASSTVASSSWPTDSLYQADVPLETSSGLKTAFAAGNGHARIVTMFYTHCPMACPLTIDTLRNLDAALSPAQRARLDVLLLSIDPGRDTPQVLRALAHERRIEDPRWTLARASDADTRKLAALLGIQYRALDTGEFDHSSVLILLDRHGRVIARSHQLGVPAAEFVAAVKQILDRDAATSDGQRSGT